MQSYHSISLSSISTLLEKTNSGSVENAGAMGTTHINSIVVNILSKKVPPPVITQRIDEFLSGFREKLLNLPEEELKSNADALSKQLLKPQQNLTDEVRRQMGKIVHHAPEILNQNKSLEDFPWESTRELADTVKKLDSKDLLEAWDNVIAGKKRSRIVSHVYGSSFPLSTANIKSGNFQTRFSNQAVNLHSIKDIEAKRKELVQFSEFHNCERLSKRLVPKKVGIALGLVGASCVMYMINTLTRKSPSVKSSTKAAGRS